MSTIDSLFMPFEVQKIKAIPLCTSMQPDYLYWPRSKDGSYEVKLGYQWLCEIDSTKLALASNFESVNGFEEKKNWKSHMPGKIKHFMWKACSNALPMRENLMKRRFTTKDTCHQCSSHSKLILHALWDCASLRQV